MDKVSLIICDIDGTLVDSQRHLSAKTREILKRVNEKGILFGIASGRPVDELKRFNELWQLDFPFDIVIGMNGSELWDELDQSFSSFYKLSALGDGELVTAVVKLILRVAFYPDKRYLVTLQKRQKCLPELDIFNHACLPLPAGFYPRAQPALIYSIADIF